MNIKTVVSLQTLLATVVAFMICYLTVPLVIRMAARVGAIDKPDGSRHLHERPTPRLGGLSIWLAFTASVCLFVPLSRQIIGILVGTTIVTVMGLLDDEYNLRPWIKLTVQLVAALVAVYSGTRIDTLSSLINASTYDFSSLSSLSVPLTVIWIVACTNAVNFIDGLDGLAAGISAIAALTMLLATVLLPMTSGIIIILLACLFGACLGFLPYNLYPAKIFMGDTGSQMLGYALSTISIAGLFKFHAIIPFVIPVMALALPLGDTVFAVLRRLRHGKNPFIGDKGHIHHRLLAIGMNQRQVVALLFVVSVFFCLASLILISPGNLLLKVVFILFVLVIAFLVQFMFFPTRQKTETGTMTRSQVGEGRHILVVSQCFYPEAFRVNDMACEWARRGYRVTVLTGVPNYPIGEFFPGYSWTKNRHEIWNNVEILRIPLIPRGHTPIGMVLNYFSFVFTGWVWNQVTEVKADLVFSFETSPMTQVKIGCWYAKKHKVPHFAYIQDLWPENVEVVTGIHSKLVIGPINRMVDKIYREVDEIFVTSPSFVEAIANRRHRVPREKIHYWPQYAEDFFRPIKAADVYEIPKDDNLKIAFTGNIGYAQGLEVLPKAAELLKGEKIKFIIVGAGRAQAKFEEEIRARGVEELFLMLPWQMPERIPDILSVCDAGFVSFSREQLWENTIPAKLQTYLACGKAVIASASGETERIIREANCGICTECGDPAALAEGIRELMHADRRQMGINARDYFEDHFKKSMLMDEMDEHFAEKLGVVEYAR